MPLLEYTCYNCGLVNEKFFKTISEGSLYNYIKCECCGKVAEKSFSIPLGFGLYGDPAGYDKPSATKRFNTKTVSRKEGNSNSVG